MRVAINLLTENPYEPTGSVQFWSHLIPEMDRRLAEDERLLLLVSPACRADYQGYGPNVGYVKFPWSNERPILRTLCEQLWTPLSLPGLKVDILDTGIAPLFNPWALVLHMKTMHAYTTPDQIPFLSRRFRRLSYPRSARMARAIIVNSNSLRDEIVRHLHVDSSKLHLVHEAVDHELFRPAGDRGSNAERLASFRVRRPFVLFLSSLWRYKNAEGLLRAWRIAKPKLGERRLAIVGFPRDADYLASLEALVRQLGIGDEVVFCGGVDHADTAIFYQLADLFVYPSFNETFGLTLLEAMASGCPVVTSNLSAMPEIAGEAALLADPHDPEDIARRMVEALEGDARERLIQRGFARAAQFTWEKSAAATLEVYRSVAKG